ncbi:hypothetical protein Dole_2203 [Desulfosudis oleivorans Hxd3]|uniref:Uncharacterized protein n=2 Tax=Desulfosudis TaxID=2904716 RepID=A8ZUH5_DESOH|nr:hypothetical protein Dole_2203 [Desulfosudis oleivorans Hxd3]
MFVSEHGRLVHVKHFVRYVAIAAGVFIVSLLVSLCCFLLFLNERSKTEKLSGDLASARQEVRVLVDRNDALLARIAALTATDTPSGTPAEPDAVADTGEKGAAPDDAASEAATVAIENLRVVQTSDTHASRIEFAVKKVGDSSDTVSGRVFVVLEGDTGAGPRTVVAPAVALNDGVPAQPGRGQYFSIARFKPVSMTVNIENPHELETATVYIFSTDGELLYEAIFPVKVVREAPAASADPSERPDHMAFVPGPFNVSIPVAGSAGALSPP